MVLVITYLSIQYSINYVDRYVSKIINWSKRIRNNKITVVIVESLWSKLVLTIRDFSLVFLKLVTSAIINR